MDNQSIRIEDWLRVSKDFLENMGKDNKVYRITAISFGALGILLMALTGIYWASGFIPIALGLVFFSMSRKPVFLSLMRFRIRDKQVLEFVDDVSASIGKFESYYSYQYLLISDQAHSIKIGQNGEIKGPGETYTQVVVNKDLFSKIDKGDEIYVLIGSDNHLYAVNYKNEIDFIWKLVPAEGKLSTEKSSIDQTVTMFGKRVRA